MKDLNVENPILWIVVPCYNEADVLNITKKMYLAELDDLIQERLISDQSRILYINDGSRDDTWKIICNMAKENEHIIGISLSRNRGHQNAVLAGLMEAKDQCDITISIDCDGQDDIHAMKNMVMAYLDGAEIVYGVRKTRETDSFFKRSSAQLYYKFLKILGVDIKKGSGGAPS